MRKLFGLAALACASNIWAGAFDSCPSDAFLVQGKISSVYSIDLATGSYRVEASDMGTSKAVNGLGFNPEDRFIYGWSYEHGTVARVHSDFKIEPLEVTNKPGKNFFVGDVSPSGSYYYVYRRGNGNGLYRIPLNPEAEDYLVMSRVVAGNVMNLRIADMAISPMDNQGYAVDRHGTLWQMNLADGTFQSLGKTGVTGAIGAAYFDIDGNLYLGRNKDGKLYRIAVATGSSTAELFAQGPSSSINDGARCALAPIVGTALATLDFGDAPDSYGTYLDSNGPRHDIMSGLRFGTEADAESDAAAYPLSDDEGDGLDDDDGVQFVTALREQSSAIAMVDASGAGYVSAWVDLNRNGAFDVDEQMIFDAPVVAGKQAIYMEMPGKVNPGESWARFRISSETGLTSQGGAIDGEVEDFMVNLVEREAVTNYYPSAKRWTTVAFEDNWPHEGDYDMNDLVVYLRSAVTSKDVGAVHVKLQGEVAAVGAAYHNGFAIRLPGVKRSEIDIDNVELMVNDVAAKWAPLEEGRDEAILMVTYNLWDYIGSGELCDFYRTQKECGSDIQMRFTASIPMLQPVAADLKGVLDPFLFATPGAWHGGHFFEAPGRGYEIHLKNRAPTEAFDMSLLDMEGVDASDPAKGLYFQTEKGMPWALEIGTRWAYPLEYNDIGHAYLNFSNFASSNGATSSDWYENDTFIVSDMLFDK